MFGQQNTKQVIHHKLHPHTLPAHVLIKTALRHLNLRLQIEAEEDVSGRVVDGLILQAVIRVPTNELMGESPGVAIALTDGCKHGLNPVPDGRVAEPFLENAAHHTLNAALGVALHQFGDIYKQLAARVVLLYKRDLEFLGTFLPA